MLNFCKTAPLQISQGTAALISADNMSAKYHLIQILNEGFYFFFLHRESNKEKEKVSLQPLPDLNLQALAEIKLICWDPHFDNYLRQQ